MFRYLDGRLFKCAFWVGKSCNKHKERSMWGHWFYLLTNYDEKKAHNMLCLMLDSKYKRLKLRSSFIGQEQRLAIVEEYDGSWFIMLLKF
jgi:hypothetical protein